MALGIDFQSGSQFQEFLSVNSQFGRHRETIGGGGVKLSTDAQQQQGQSLQHTPGSSITPEMHLNYLPRNATQPSILLRDLELAGTAFRASASYEEDSPECLLEHSVRATAEHCSPLHHARKTLHGSCARVLIDAGADVNDMCAWLGTPLLTAIKGEWTEGRLVHVVQDLLSRGADPNARYKNGSTALHVAATLQQPETMRLLIEHGADPNARDEYGYTALLLAAAKDRQTVMRVLVEHGADVLVTDSQGTTALHSTARSHEGLATRLLVEHGADVNARDKSGNTPLHFAASSKRDTNSMVQFLLDHGADANTKNRHGNTALHYSSQSGSHQKTRLLLEAGADLHALDRNKLTALHLAVLKGKSETVSILLDHGASVDKIALNLTKRGGNVEAMKIFKEHQEKHVGVVPKPEQELELNAVI